jgi:hypothetical protein
MTPISLYLNLAPSRTITIGSIYGTNDDDEEFFHVLGSKIEQFNFDHVILGEDWNCMYDTRNSRNNTDILNPNPYGWGRI